MTFRISFLLVVLAASSACTPVRSKLSPPYLLDGMEFSAVEMQDRALGYCKEVVEHSGGVELPPHPFTTDGCSAWPESSIQGCCLKHDIAYWCGVGDREEIDDSFRRCISKSRSRTYANIAYLGVRLGGGRFVPFPWRFGYGHRWPFRKAPTPGYMHDVVSQSEPSPQIPLTKR